MTAVLLACDYLSGSVLKALTLRTVLVVLVIIPWRKVTGSELTELLVAELRERPWVPDENWSSHVLTGSRRFGPVQLKYFCWSPWAFSPPNPKPYPPHRPPPKNKKLTLRTRSAFPDQTLSLGLGIQIRAASAFLSFDYIGCTTHKRRLSCLPGARS